MQINWFTVIAQVINFLILVWLLKRFLYKPVLDAIDQREKKIVSQLHDADAKEKKAIKEQDEYAKKNDMFEKGKKELMDKAIAETNEERQKLLEAARNDATVLRDKLDKSLKEMQENMNRDIVQKTQEEVFAIARKTLTDLASIDLEEQMTTIFIKRLNDLKSEEKKQFIDAFKKGSNSILIQCAFDLPQKQQSEIKTVVHKILDTETAFQFNTAPKIISGIELSSNGYKLSWSITEYLSLLQKDISETLSNNTLKNDIKKEHLSTQNKLPTEVKETKAKKAHNVEPKVKTK
jgi:F-type H+-transporting ATPase subunit b